MTQEPVLKDYLKEGLLMGLGVGLLFGLDRVVKFYRNRNFRIRLLKSSIADLGLKDAVRRKQEKLFKQKVEQAGRKLSKEELKKLMREARKEVLRNNVVRGVLAAELIEPTIRGAVYGVGLSGLDYIKDRIIHSYDAKTNSRNQQ